MARPIAITHSTDAKFTDISVNNIGSNTSNLKILTDASFDNNVDISNKLFVGNDISVNGSVVSNDGELGFAGRWDITANGEIII